MFILSTGRGCPFITAHRGRISVVSIIFAPMTFPTERELSFLRIAVSVVTNSGKDVPRAMTVKPIIVSLIPIPEAIVFADETRNSAPKTMDCSVTIDVRLKKERYRKSDWILLE